MAVPWSSGAQPPSVFLCLIPALASMVVPGSFAVRAIPNPFPNLPCAVGKLAPAASICLVPGIIGFSLHLTNGRHWLEFGAREEGRNFSAFVCPSGAAVSLWGSSSSRRGPLCYSLCGVTLHSAPATLPPSFAFHCGIGGDYLLLLISRSSHHSV